MLYKRCPSSSSTATRTSEHTQVPRSGVFISEHTSRSVKPALVRNSRSSTKQPTKREEKTWTGRTWLAPKGRGARTAAALLICGMACNKSHILGSFVFSFISRKLKSEEHGGLAQQILHAIVDRAKIPSPKYSPAVSPSAVPISAGQWGGRGRAGFWIGC